MSIRDAKPPISLFSFKHEVATQSMSDSNRIEKLSTNCGGSKWLNPNEFW